MKKLLALTIMAIITHTHTINSGNFDFTTCDATDKTACGNNGGTSGYSALNYCQTVNGTTQGVCIPTQFSGKFYQNSANIPGIFNSCVPNDKLGACGNGPHSNTQSPYYVNYLQCVPYPTQTAKTGICLPKD